MFRPRDKDAAVEGEVQWLRPLKPARDAYLALDEAGRASVRVFLVSLAREPKLFVP